MQVFWYGCWLNNHSSSVVRGFQNFFRDEELVCKCGWLTENMTDSKINEPTGVCYRVSVFIANLPSAEESCAASGDCPQALGCVEHHCLS